MALGALIAAYHEDDQGTLRALFPLAGRTLIEYQARCVAAVGAAPIVVMVERIPAALNDAFERLRVSVAPCCRRCTRPANTALNSTRKKRRNARPTRARNEG